MGYKHKKIADGILVPNVRVVKPIAKAERRELQTVGRDLDEGFMRQAVARFEKETAAGKIYPLTLNHRGKRVGRKVGQRVVEHNGKPTIAEDLLITDPQTQERWLRGELPEISADIDLENPEIYATSLLETGEGHFGHNDIGQFYPDELKVALKGEGRKLENCICLMAEKENAMDREEMLKLFGEFKTGLLSDIDAKIKPVLELAKKPANTDPLDPQNDVIREREKGEVLLRDAEDKHKLELAREQDIARKLSEAATVDVGMNLKAYEDQLRKRDTQAREDYHRLCLERARNGRNPVKQSDDPTLKGKSRVELELAADFRREKEQWEKLGMTEERYLEMVGTKRAQREAARTLTA